MDLEHICVAGPIGPGKLSSKLFTLGPRVKNSANWGGLEHLLFSHNIQVYFAVIFTLY